MGSEISQMEKDRHRMTSLCTESQKPKQMQKRNESVGAEIKLMVAKGMGWGTGIKEK